MSYRSNFRETLLQRKATSVADAREAKKSIIPSVRFIKSVLERIAPVINQRAKNNIIFLSVFIPVGLKSFANVGKFSDDILSDYRLIKQVPRVRIELTTPASSELRSTTELPRHTQMDYENHSPFAAEIQERLYLNS